MPQSMFLHRLRGQLRRWRRSVKREYGNWLWLWRHPDVTVEKGCNFIHPDRIEIGAGTHLRDYVTIVGGQGVRIGECCDLQPKVTIWGGGSLEVGEYTQIGLHSCVVTGEYLMKDADGKPMRMVDYGAPHLAVYEHTAIRPDAYVGANVVIRKGMTIGQGAIVGAGAFVNRDVPNWTVAVGTPAKPIGERPVL
jgi:acetyltransferase-like isoleucine patch superfamily enzyme